MQGEWADQLCDPATRGSTVSSVYLLQSDSLTGTKTEATRHSLQSIPECFDILHSLTGLTKQIPPHSRSFEIIWVALDNYITLQHFPRSGDTRHIRRRTGVKLSRAQVCQAVGYAHVSGCLSPGAGPPPLSGQTPRMLAPSEHSRLLCFFVCM
jgi:hypothetical protein